MITITVSERHLGSMLILDKDTSSGSIEISDKKFLELPEFERQNLAKLVERNSIVITRRGVVLTIDDILNIDAFETGTLDAIDSDHDDIVDKASSLVEGTTVVEATEIRQFIDELPNIYYNKTQINNIVASLPNNSEVAGATVNDALNTIRETSKVFSDPMAFSDLGIVVDNGANAYYPSVIYDANAFDTNTPYKFKCFYSTGTVIRVINSMDGITWTTPIAAIGLSATAHHPTITYSREGFGEDINYKIWYWNSSISNLLISTIRYAESIDGITWTNDQAITQDSSLKLITGVSGAWNSATWGFQKVFYNNNAKNTGTNPFDYSYSAYYDCNTGTTYQTTGLAYSIDGKNWFSDRTTPVLDRNSSDSNAWDYYATSFGSYLKNIDGHHCWYTGGKATTYTDNFGIGYAHSIDGINWIKSTNNPIFTVLDGLTYRNERCYTPSVVDDNVGTIYMFYTAQGTAQTGRKKLGLATLKYEANTGKSFASELFNNSTVTGSSIKDALELLNTTKLTKNSVSGSFTTVDGKTITIVDGQVTEII